ncbi:hypothetical protein EK21DRAFT_109348 [Setomelanomma holmii]|uniref:Uncharacterized protein n=1 Tax=Setomelanomma holmii TaxID=210430 RepID=A0A9P4HGM1_9PLEO|nr:hypothetical protein EK21DRAFT_109348 [Setomelanomma holmii]
MNAPRLNPWEFDDDVAPDEALPDYEDGAAPAYESGTYDHPLVTYHLRQYDKKIQMLVAYGPAATSSYRITTNGFRLFSKKPEMEVLQTSREMKQRNMATMGFDNDGPLPWFPRAHFRYIDGAGEATKYAMEAQNFADWQVQCGDHSYEWSLATQPSSLVLRENSSSIVIARFTYSACGMMAARGAEVGELVIYRDALTLEVEGIDKLVCSLVISMTHLKRMGRHYTNNDANKELLRSASLPRAYMPSHRMSSAGVSMI